MCKVIANAIVGGMYGTILSWNVIERDYVTVLFTVVGWIGFLVYMGTKGE